MHGDFARSRWPAGRIVAVLEHTRASSSRWGKMNFVLNASRLAALDFATVAARAAEAGYAHVELAASTDDVHSTSDNILLSDAGKIREIFDAAGVGIVALSSEIDEWAESFAEQMTAIFDAAQRLGATMVRVPSCASRPATASSDRLVRVADDAARRNIRLALENAPTAASANEIWVLLERLEHPALGCSLNLSNLTLGGQSPYQVVPTLNQKIIYAEIGDGDARVQEFLTRLLGIGYGGYVAVELREPAPENARDGLTKLREWAQRRAASPAGGRRTKAKAH